MMHFPKRKEETVKIHPKPRLLSALVFFLTYLIQDVETKVIHQNFILFYLY